MTLPNVEGKGMMSVHIVGGTSLAAGALCSMANPEGVALLVLRSYLYVKAHSTGAANINVGIGATAATDATDMISALAMGGAIDGKVYNGNVQTVATKTELSAPVVWTADKFLQATGSADTTGLDATLYVEYVRAP